MDDFSEAQKIFLKNLFANLNSTIAEKTSEIRTEIQKQVNDIKEDITIVVNKLQDKVEKLEKENNTLQKKLVFLERKVRKNNIIIFGIEKNTSNILESIVTLFNETLEIPVKHIDINDVYRLDTKSSEEPPIVVEFISYQQKLAVLKNAYKLKGRNIFIARDQCQEDRENTKKLLIHQKEARNKGKTAYIKGGKLFVENESYTIDQLQSEEKQESAVEILEKPESAPSTPNPISREKYLLNQLGFEEENEREVKKFKPTLQSVKKLTESSTKIQTRSACSNSVMKNN